MTFGVLVVMVWFAVVAVMLIRQFLSGAFIDAPVAELAPPQRVLPARASGRPLTWRRNEAPGGCSFISPPFTSPTRAR